MHIAKGKVSRTEKLELPVFYSCWPFNVNGLLQGGEGGMVNIHSEYPERRVCEESRRERGRREEVF